MERVIPPALPIPATATKTAVCKPPLLEKLLLVVASLVVAFFVVAFLRLLLGFCLVGRGLSLFTLLLLPFFFGPRLSHDLRRIAPFDESHRSEIAFARTELDDGGVAAVTPRRS